jgi:nucleotide-binding universal stress UspA family protein
LIRMGGMLIAGGPGRLYALHLIRPEAVDRPVSTNWNEADYVLEVARKTAQSEGLSLNTVGYVSRKIGLDIADAAKRYRASWVVIGWHKPVFFRNLLGGVVGQVLEQAPANVAVLVDKGLGAVTRIVVPYLGDAQDHSALLAARLLGKLPDVKLTLLCIVKPTPTGSEAGQATGIQADKDLPDAIAGSVRVKVVESQGVIDAVVDESQHHDLLVLGLTDKWNLRSGKLVGKQETVAQRAKCSVLIVHANAQAPVVQSDASAPKPEELSPTEV